MMDADMLDVVYIGVLLSNMMALAILWRVLPGLLKKSRGKLDKITDHRADMRDLSGLKALRKFSHAVVHLHWHRHDARPQQTLLR